MKFLVALLFTAGLCVAQTPNPGLPDFDAVDSLYREDQFYVGFTYNILQQRPEGVRQNKFSAGFYAGMLRDMPINDSRTVSIAAGLGYSLQNYSYNLIIAGDADNPSYSIINEQQNFYNKNKLSLHFVELPVEFRWRTSTPESHRFWRVYTGLKFSYLFHSRSVYEGEPQNALVKQNADLNQLRYGLYLSTGYNTWNFYIYYGLNPLFKKDAQLDGKPLDMKTLNMGLMFYIL
jgi:hypothetical protein